MFWKQFKVSVKKKDTHCEMVEVANGAKMGFGDGPSQSSWDVVHSRSLEICTLKYATAFQRKNILFIRKQIGNRNEKVLGHSKVILFMETLLSCINGHFIWSSSVKRDIEKIDF